MYKRFITFILLVQVSLSSAAALKGTVIDSVMNTPVGYANVMVFDKTDSLITGTITRDNGTFELASLNPGMYKLDVKFIGYHHKYVDDIRVEYGRPTVDLGVLKLHQSVLEGQEIYATAEKLALEYQIDKKVVNVAKQYTAASGTAVDVLESVPSVTVDIEGNVSLRGSSSFQVLIDGRPSILDANDALKQIPASSIENIEIITNPSAKYDPDGTSGILNIVSKKNSLNGINGTVNVNASSTGRYGADMLLNYRAPKYNAYVGLDYREGKHPGSMFSDSRIMVGDTTFFTTSDGESGREFGGYGVKVGVDWNITPNDLFGIATRIGDRSFNMSSETAYEKWIEPSDAARELYSSMNESERGGEYGNVTMNYQHKFAKKGHELTADADYRFRGGDDMSSDELRDAQGVITSGRKSGESGPGTRLRVKADYVYPINDQNKFEAGYQSRISSSTDETDLSEYSPITMQYELQPEFSYKTVYDRNIHSLYSQFSTEFGKLGVMGGFRGEYTNRVVELETTGDTFKIDRWDFFPTTHASYKFSQMQQMMASYTRRIERPRGYYFEPFLTWTDAYNVRSGNPAIKPEYIDSFEGGYQQNVGRNMFSVELYYRITNNKIERVQSVYDNDVMLHTVDNVGKDYSLGTELMVNMDIFDWWNLNTMGNIYRYEIDGALNGVDFSRTSNNWSLRFNNTFKVTSSTRIQFNGMYHSASVSAQGTREGFWMSNFAVKQDLLDKKLELVFQVRDVFKQGKYEFTSEGADFYRYNRFTREAPVYSLTLNYIINNYKRERGRNGGDGDMEGGGGFEEM